MRSILCCLAAFCVFLCPALLIAQQPTRQVIVSASRADSELGQIGSSVTVIDAEEIERSQYHSVADILRSRLGIDVVRSGPSGGNIAVFSRGLNSEHTLVLVDGIETNNPISTNRAFNFADLTLDNIERIEIVRGPQSTLYGSDALGGVINIITKAGSDQLSTTASIEAGSYESYLQQMSLRGREENVLYSLAIANSSSEGISSANKRSGNHERDGYDNLTLSSRFDLELNKSLSANIVARYNDSSAELDNSGGSAADDPNRELDNQQFFGKTEIEVRSIPEQLSHTISVSLSDQSFEDNNDPDPAHPVDILRSRFDGSLLKFDIENQLIIDQGQTLTFGVETEQEKGESRYFSDGVFGPFNGDFPERDARTNSVYTEFLSRPSEQLSLVLGARVDDHSKFGSETTWRIAPSYKIEETETRVFSSLGTGYKAPSLFQLYSSFGDPNLKAEESLGWDIGIEQQLIDQIASLSMTYFWNDLDQLISFNSDTFKSENIGEARTSGVESELVLTLTDSLNAALAYTYTDTEDRDTGFSLLRRARHKGRFSADWSSAIGLDLGLDYVYTGSSFDNDFSTFPASRTELSSFNLVTIRARYALSERLGLNARVENLLDQEYEQVLGYGNLGTSGFLGLTYKL
jgi:vitamin B12 transporter